MMDILKEISHFNTNEVFSSSWKSPSNIALIKYWGKKGYQLPANPSLSMTLKECFTQTTIDFTPSSDFSLELYFNGQRAKEFERKIVKMMDQFSWPLLSSLKLVIQTENSFPHGVGIASSASGMSALSLCLVDYFFHLLGKDQSQKNSSLFFQTASFLSRLFSGSACRSIYGGFTTWGDESDEYASELKAHETLYGLKNSILIIDDQEKKVSSSQGHGRMKDHVFAEARFDQARSNFSIMKNHVVDGRFDMMGKIIESEALSLHAMMMTSPEPYTLLSPHSLTAMDLIRTFRLDTQIPVFFTLDAGPNLHVLYSEENEDKVKTFLKNEFKGVCSDIIHDQVGEGPMKCL